MSGSKPNWTSLEGYELRSGRWSRKIAPEFVAWLSVDEDREWLDVGCGAGALLQAIIEKKRPKHVVGCDRSKEGLAAARLAFGERVKLVQASCESMPFANRNFGAVVSGLLLNLLIHPDRAMTEMVRVIRPGGVIAAYVWDFGEGMQMMRTFWDAAIAIDARAVERDQAKKFTITNERSLTALFERSGIESINTRGFEAPTVFRNFDDFWEPLLNGEGSIPNYAKSLKPRRLKALRERLLTSLPTRIDRRIPLVARAWAVRGRAPS
jgi:ubiquinone/menaquinone biosynthesis C-methylase UbiE